jgi:hypothetical protein
MIGNQLVNTYDVKGLAFPPGYEDWKPDYPKSEGCKLGEKRNWSVVSASPYWGTGSDEEFLEKNNYLTIGAGIGLAIASSPMGTGIDGNGKLCKSVVAVAYQTGTTTVGNSAGVTLNTTSDGLSAIIQRSIDARRTARKLDTIEIKVVAEWEECVKRTILNGNKWSKKSTPPSKGHRYTGSGNFSSSLSVYESNIASAIDDAYQTYFE